MIDIISKQHDSRKKSLCEAIVNSFGAFPIAYAVGVFILPSSVKMISQDIFLASIYITMVYTTVSFSRVYFLRRLFARFGYDDNLIRLLIKFYRWVDGKRR